MIFSIATKCHIGVIHSNNSMWTTNESGDMEECDVLFLNRGKLMFEAVESIEVEQEDEEAKPVLRNKTQHIIPKKRKRIIRVEEMVKTRKRKGTVEKKRNGKVKKKRKGMVKKKKKGMVKKKRKGMAKKKRKVKKARRK